jgi:hypothetical protein
VTSSTTAGALDYDWIFHLAVVAGTVLLWIPLYIKALRPHFHRLNIRVQRITLASFAFGVVITALLITIGLSSPGRAELPWEAGDMVSFLEALTLMLLSVVIPAFAVFWLFGALAISKRGRTLSDE